MKNLLKCNRFLVMGVLNMTADSFYDGGKYDSIEKAVERAFRIKEEGAHILDVGAESTRPFSEGVTEETEKKKITGLLEALGKNNFGIPVSVDTQKAGVARAALDLGAEMINDVSAGRNDEKMFKTVSEYGAHVVLMHMKGTPKTMQSSPFYEDAPKEVKKELLEFAKNAVEAGIARDKIVLDPGIGFGKRVEDNLKLISRLDELCAAKFPVMVGISRKSLIGNITNTRPEERLPGTIAFNAAAFMRGAKIFRVHDVKENIRALECLSALPN